jgi:hypothetical protein
LTISSTTRIAGPFVGNGTASVFPFTFKVFAAADLDVIRLATSTGVETTLVLNSDYTVSLNGNQNTNPGGSVTLSAGALASGFTLTITSDIANLQPTDLTNQGGFYPEVITDSLDRATIQIQQMAEDVGRSLKAPLSDGTPNMEMPNATNRASKYLVFDANGLPSVSAGSGTDTALRTDLANTTVALAGSSLVGFRANAASSTGRTVLDKLRDVVSVKDFGAVGDGVTDDTAAFIAAIATIPAYSSITYAANGTPSASGGPSIEVPPGLYKITQTLVFTNKAPCVLRGSSDTGLGAAPAVQLLWYGAANQPIVNIDGGCGVCFDQISVNGRAIAGYGILFTRSNVAYSRGLGYYKNVHVTGCTIAGIQFGLADYVNLDQTDNSVFDNIHIHGCYDGIVSLNRNNLNLQFNNLTIVASYPPTGITPRHGIRLIEGGIEVHGYYCGGIVGQDFSGYCIYLENAYINVFGGYTETNADEAAPSGQVITSTIVGFAQYPAVSAPQAVYWNQAGNTLSWYGGRIAQDIEEGPNSGGIFITNARFHNVPTWTGRTAKSACVNCNVIRTANPAEAYQLNWIGKSASNSCFADADMLLSNNLQMRDSLIVRYVNQESVALRLLTGEFRLYHAASGGSGYYNQNYTSFTEMFRVGYSTTDGRWMGNGTNRAKWAAAAPTTGTWVQGDIVWNTGVAAGGSPGWVCTTGGTPGTWKAMANVAP